MQFSREATKSCQGDRCSSQVLYEFILTQEGDQAGKRATLSTFSLNFKLLHG